MLSPSTNGTTNVLSSQGPIQTVVKGVWPSRCTLVWLVQPMRISRRTVLTRVKNENKLLFNKRQPSRVIYPVKTGIIRQTDYCTVWPLQAMSINCFLIEHVILRARYQLVVFERTTAIRREPLFLSWPVNRSLLFSKTCISFCEEGRTAGHLVNSKYRKLFYVLLCV